MIETLNFVVYLAGGVMDLQKVRVEFIQKALYYCHPRSSPGAHSHVNAVLKKNRN